MILCQLKENCQCSLRTLGCEYAYTELSPLIKELANAIEEKGMKMTFGITPANRKVIEDRLANGWPIRSKETWELIGKEIGWEPMTIALWYLDEQIENLRNGKEK